MVSTAKLAIYSYENMLCRSATHWTVVNKPHSCHYAHPCVSSATPQVHSKQPQVPGNSGTYESAVALTLANLLHLSTSNMQFKCTPKPYRHKANCTPVVFCIHQQAASSKQPACSQAASRISHGLSKSIYSWSEAS